MSKLSNTLTMLNLLNTGKKYSVSELAQILEVTPRMIRSYKDDLDKCGIYVDTIRGPYGGYVLNQSIKTPTIKLKKDDYEFLCNLDVKKDDREKLREIIDKIRGVYLSDNENKNIISSEIKNTYNNIERAIKEKRKVEIEYYSYTKGLTKRVIHPLDMFYMSNGWGCAAYCELRNDLRHFELKRIENIKLLEESFE